MSTPKPESIEVIRKRFKTWGFVTLREAMVAIGTLLDEVDKLKAENAKLKADETSTNP